jgi:hypothetical protein
MREDDTHMRRSMPLLRRIIILAAVVTAVPVVMWSTTALVRAYLGPPKGPTAQEAAPLSAVPDEVTSTAPTTNPPPAAPADTKTVQLAPVPPTNPAVGATSGSPNAGGTTVTVTASVPPAPKTSAKPAPVPAAQPPVASAPPPKIAMSDPAPSPPPNPAPGGAPLASDRVQSDIWPAPPATAGATADLTSPTADATPQSEPLAGPVPLPRRRPTYFVLAQAGGVPLPRPRPTATAPGLTDAPPSPFEWLHNIFRPGSSTAPTGSQQDFTSEH